MSERAHDPSGSSALEGTSDLETPMSLAVAILIMRQ
jgi:hypothetical protein